MTKLYFAHGFVSESSTLIYLVPVFPPNIVSLELETFRRSSKFESESCVTIRIKLVGNCAIEKDNSIVTNITDREIKVRIVYKLARVVPVLYRRPRNVSSPQTRINHFDIQTTLVEHSSLDSQTGRVFLDKISTKLLLET